MPRKLPSKRDGVSKPKTMIATIGEPCAKANEKMASRTLTAANESEITRYRWLSKSVGTMKCLTFEFTGLARLYAQGPVE
jgi:hypothetical protein